VGNAFLPTTSKRHMLGYAIANPIYRTELDADDAEKMMRLIDCLEVLDDVQAVYSNADISDEIMAGLN